MIYFLQDGDQGPIKIGYTSKKSKIRLQCCQTYHYKEIVMIAEAAGTEELEKALHRILQPWNIRGEWFQNSHEVMEVVKSVQEGIQIRDLVDATDSG